MGLMDAFSAEDRVEITVKELITILDARAKAESAFEITMNMLREGVSPQTVRAVFGYKPDIKPVMLDCETIKGVKNNAK